MVGNSKHYFKQAIKPTLDKESKIQNWRGMFGVQYALYATINIYNRR